MSPARVRPGVSFTGEIHPVADLFPVLASDDISDLANDIKANGLLHPIVLDSKGRILDGRNRLAACVVARITPVFETFVGDDDEAAAYALSANLSRRSMTKGQKAMVVVNAGRLFSNQSQRTIAPLAGTSQPYVAKATAVADFAPDLAEGVVNGAMALNDAYDAARKRKAEAESAEKQMAKLLDEAPDLAVLVTEERMTLADATAAAAERARKAKEARRDARNLLDRVINLIAPVDTDSTRFAEDWLAQMGGPDAVTPTDLARLDNAVHILTQLQKAVRPDEYVR